MTHDKREIRCEIQEKLDTIIAASVSGKRWATNTSNLLSELESQREQYEAHMLAVHGYYQRVIARPRGTPIYTIRRPMLPEWLWR